jgi:hypothetical protein
LNAVIARVRLSMIGIIHQDRLGYAFRKSRADQLIGVFAPMFANHA